MVEKHRAKLAEIRKQRLVGLQTLAKELRDKSISIEANANDEGHLYGSVGPEEISRALRVDNVVLEPNQIMLTGPLKELGLYTVRIYLGHDIESEIKVWVVPVVSSGDRK
jgi:large subunit ribosomal protein L9